MTNPTYVIIRTYCTLLHILRGCFHSCTTVDKDALLLVESCRPCVAITIPKYRRILNSEANSHILDILMRSITKGRPLLPISHREIDSADKIYVCKRVVFTDLEKSTIVKLHVYTGNKLSAAVIIYVDPSSTPDISTSLISIFSKCLTFPK